MNSLRAILIALLVTAASFGALFIPLRFSEAVTRPTPATGATISLVDSLPSVPEQPKTTRVQTQVAEPSTLPSVEEALLLSDDGVAILENELAPQVESSSDPIEEPSLNSETLPIDPVQDTPIEEESVKESEAEHPSNSLDDSPASEASDARSVVSSDPLPSLINGYYEAPSVDRGPSFNRAALASRIKYPSLAKRQGREGLVMLRLFISASGKVERIEVEEDPGYGLAEAAVRAFTGLQGEPATLGGKAVPVTLRYPVRFSLQ